MKRLLVLLIVVAGGLAAAALAVPTTAATVNGVAISQQQLNSDLAAIGGSTDYQCFLNAEQAVSSGGQTNLPRVIGAGQVVGSGSHPTVTTVFAASYLDTAIGHQLVLELAASKHLPVTSQDLSTARKEFVNQITVVLQDVAGSKFACRSGLTAAGVARTLPSSFVNENVQFDATLNVLEENLAGVGSSTAELERYFRAHAAEFDKACFTVAEYQTLSDAEAAEAMVAAGTPFAQVAAGVSGGGPKGCNILYPVAAGLPGSNLDSLAVNTVSQPITESGVYLLIEITSKTPTPFAAARSLVERAVQNAGLAKAQTAISAAEKSAAVTVDQRYGKWVPGGALVLAPSSPLATDVLNPAVNGSGSAPPTASAPSSGQTP